jgi:hypothetical protein
VWNHLTALQGEIVVKRNIKGFDIGWIGDARFEATRSVPPKHEYDYETSPDQKRLKKLDFITPADVPKGDPLIDAQQFEHEAWEAAKEFVRLENASPH